MTDNITTLSQATIKENVDRCCGAIEIYLKTLQRENEYYINKVKENETA